jgi:hypothetical protein
MKDPQMFIPKDLVSFLTVKKKKNIYLKKKKNFIKIFFSLLFFKCNKTKNKNKS